MAPKGAVYVDSEVRAFTAQHLALFNYFRARCRVKLLPRIGGNE